MIVEEKPEVGSIEVVDQAEIVKVIKPGTILWRPFSVSQPSNNISTAKVQMNNVELKPSPKGGFVGRVSIAAGGWLSEPLLHGGDGAGIVTFIKHVPPIGWNFMVVTATSRNGNAIFAEYKKTMNQEAYVTLMKKSYQLRAMNLNMPFEEFVKLVIEKLPLNLSDNLKRLSAGLVYTNGEARMGYRYLPRKFDIVGGDYVPVG